jgi:hypothetical protein
MLKACKYCGKIFYRLPKRANAFCSEECRKAQHRKNVNQWNKKARKNGLKDNSLGCGTILENLNIITVNGEPRVKGTVALQQLIKKRKTND